MSNHARLEEVVSDLRNRMGKAGCVFEFTVSNAPIGVQISQSNHHHALERLFGQLNQVFQQHRLDAIARDPTLEPLKFFTLEFDPALATASPVHLLEVSADGSSWLKWLEQAFTDPPYGSLADGALFAEFCAVIGLTADAEVLDWVGDPDLEPQRSDWSNYFDAGKEWWGIWCATIWNPTTRTLSAIAASSSD